MPNWYTTTIIAKGHESDLDRIVAAHIVPAEDRYRKHVGDHVFEMDTAIPVPEAIKNTKAYRHYWGGGHIVSRKSGSYGPQEMSIDEYEQSDWYKWLDANWSGETWTKDLGVLRKPGELTISFTTRWSPPLPVLRRLCEMYPQVQFKFSGYDHQNDWDEGPHVLLEPEEAC